MELQLVLPGVEMPVLPPKAHFATEMVLCQCGESVQFSEGLYLFDVFYCCDECAEDDDLVRCEGCEDWLEDDNSHEYDYNKYCQDCFYEDYFHCEGCGDAEPLDISCYVDNVGSYCQSCFDNNYFYCCECNEVYDHCEAVSCDNGLFCSECAPSGGDGSDWVGRNETYDKVGNRRFGVELEFNDADRHVCFDHIENGTDHCGYEFRSGVMYGDGGFDAIKRFTDHAERHGWSARRDCGYHLHVDCSDLSLDQVKRVAYAYIKTAKFWENCVDPKRETCGYADYNSKSQNKEDRKRLPSIGSLADFKRWGWNKSRYYFINWAAFNKFGTVEIRGHEGTNDSTAIGNWITAHTRFVDYVKDISLADLDKMFSETAWNDYPALESIIGSDICDYYAKKAQSNGKQNHILSNRQVVGV